MDSVDVVVIGAGAVGLACARKFSDSGLSTIVLESESGFGFGASSRNSEVIHAGLYYPPGSLKAELCLRGRELLYEYCQARGINHSQVGKWVVANGPTQIAALDKIAKTARANGCDEVYWIDGSEAVEQEPELIAERVLVSPRTGIIDSHAYMLCLLADLESKGGMFVPRTAVIAGKSVDGGIVLKTQGNGEFELRAKFVVNSAGLNAPFLARKFGSKQTPTLPEKGFAKGNYFSLGGKSPFQRLIYPVPEPDGLGVHLTLSLDGRARFGPDVEWVSNVSYDVDSNRKEAFGKAIRKYWRNFDPERLHPDYAGIRSKVGAGSALSDFIISSPEHNGIPGLVNLLGIESPGLTASLAIADTVFNTLNINSMRYT